MWGILSFNMEIWTISKTLDWTTEHFRKHNIEWPHLEAEILLAHALGRKRIELYTDHEKVLTEKELKTFKGHIQRRSQHEPIAYITNCQPFMSLDLYVDQNVLIPRPETEQLVEIAIDCLKHPSSPIPHPTIADIGTGSGAIAVSLAKFIPGARVTGIDASEAAIKIAQKNAKTHKVDDRCKFIAGNMFDPLQEKADLIVSNPPYIPTDIINALDTDVKDWEPKSALDGGKDGLNYIRELIVSTPRHLTSGGYLLSEIGDEQGEKAKQTAESSGNYSRVEILKDLNQKDRILKARVL